LKNFESNLWQMEKEGKIVANRFRTTQQNTASQIEIEISGIQYTISNIHSSVPSTHRHRHRSNLLTFAALRLQ